MRSLSVKILYSFWLVTKMTLPILFSFISRTTRSMGVCGIYGGGIVGILPTSQAEARNWDS